MMKPCAQDATRAARDSSSIIHPSFVIQHDGSPTAWRIASWQRGQADIIHPSFPRDQVVKLLAGQTSDADDQQLRLGPGGEVQEEGAPGHTARDVLGIAIEL